MKAVINRRLFTQTNLDSGALTILGTVVHRFAAPGEYQGTVLLDEQLVSTFRLLVDEHCSAMQLNIDLVSLDFQQSCDFVVNPEGYTVFQVSRGSGGYAVVVRHTDEGYESQVFDSRALNKGDLCSATLLRPGIYRVTNAHTRAQGEIIVAYPNREALRCPLEPVAIECKANGFIPNRVETQSTQGLVYRFEIPSRIQIDLIEANDGPASN